MGGAWLTIATAANTKPSAGHVVVAVIAGIALLVVLIYIAWQEWHDRHR